MGKEILTFRYIEFVKNRIYHHKTPIFKKDVDIKKVWVSKKITSGQKKYKYFIGYLYNDHKVMPVHIILPKAGAYVKSYDGQNGCIFWS